MAQRTPPPESIPNYIADGLPKQDDATLRDIIVHCEELLEQREKHEPEIPDNAEVVEENDGGSLVKEKVRCGKDSCRCNEGKLHGPYVYRYWSVNSQTKKEYVGKPD